MSALSVLDRFLDVRMLVLGDVMLDRYVYGKVERISPEAPIPVMTVHKELDMPGGAANVVRNAASLGAHATLIGVTGDDVWARDLRAQLDKMSTITAVLITDGSRPTTRKTRFVADRQQLLRADREQRDPLPEGISKRVLAEFYKALPDATVVVLSDYAKGVLSEAVTRSAIEAAKSAGKPVIVDPKSSQLRRYLGATVLTPNRQELESACGHACTSEQQVTAAARRFIEEGICQSMVVTRGAKGMSIVDSTTATHLPARAREVFDVSGAGDTAIATLAMGLATGADLITCAEIANAAAGLVVAKLGTAVVTTGEIAAFLTQFDGRSDHGKLFSLERVTELARGWHAQGLKIAFTNGCFDLLHTGHLSLIEQARSSADRLIVGLNSDLSVRRLKGTERPVQGEVARATILSSLRAVDAVVIFAEDTPAQLIETLLPDVLVKGSDYSIDQVVGADTVMAQGGRVLLVELITGQSTSGIVARASGARIS